MTFDFNEFTLNECLDKVIDNRGKTPPITDSITPYPLIEINAIVGHAKTPNFSVIKKYVTEETYCSWFRAGHPQPDDVIFSTVGSIAEVAIFKGGSGCIAQNLVGLRPNIKLITPDFLYYSLVSPSMQSLLRTLDISSVQPSIKVPHLLATKLKLPPLKEQKIVGNILSVLDDRITLLQESNLTLEAIAQALFKSWFVDFDPVRAKQEGRQPEGMDEATAELFPDAFEESEFGLIPKGWTHISFGSLLSQTIGGDWGGEVADEINDTRVAIIRGTDIPDLQRSVGNRVPIRFTSQKKLATRKLEDGDIVIEVSGGSKDQPTGRSLHVTKALLDQFDCPVEPASFCRLMRPINKKIDSLLAQHMTYIYAQGKTWEYQNQSTGIANFQTTYFLENEMVVNPTETVLSAFSEIVQVLMGRTQTMQIQTLSNLRDTLLPRLISGQLRIADAQAELEKAMV